MHRSYIHYSDKELVELLKSGKKAETELAFAEIYCRYSVNVKTYTRCMINSLLHAEDIFQETFVSLYKNIQAGNNIENISAYLIGTARNLTLNYRRDKKTTVDIEEDILIADERSDYDKKELMSLITDALPLLDDIYREAFVLRELEGLPYEEVARITGVTLSGAKTRVARAHKKLIDILQPYMKDMQKHS